MAHLFLINKKYVKKGEIKNVILCFNSGRHRQTKYVGSVFSVYSYVCYSLFFDYPPAKEKTERPSEYDR